jgi:hypothetical protein
VQQHPDDKPRRRGGAALRVVGVIAAVALTAAAAWLIVTGESQKRIEIGVLVGLWGALIAAYSMFARHRSEPASSATDGALPAPGQGHMPAEAEARRQWEYRLEQMIRRQIQAALAAEVQSLRSEVAAMRGELVEKVGGQIQLERIEITRVIGSDIEALQREVRQLKAVRTFGVLPSESEPVPAVGAEQLHVLEAVEMTGPVQIVNGAQPEQVAGESQANSVVLLSDQPTTLIPAVAAASAPAEPVPLTPARPAVPTTQPPATAPVQPSAPAEAPAPAVPAAAVPAAAVEARPLNADTLFAALPRLSPFSASDLDDAAPKPNGHGNAPAAQPVGTPVPTDLATPVAATTPSAEELEATEQAAARARGRHSVNDMPRSGGRRRRRADDQDDVLARVLAREGRR